MFLMKLRCENYGNIGKLALEMRLLKKGSSLNPFEKMVGRKVISTTEIINKRSTLH